MLTLLSNILNRINRWQELENTEEKYQVNDIDEAIRSIRRETQLPWTLRKGSLKVFDGIYEYPVAVDHDELAYVDDNRNNPSSSTRVGSYGERLRFIYTSLQQFFENVDSDRNLLAEIFDTNVRYLGVRLNSLNNISIVPSILTDNATNLTNYTASNDANSLFLDIVTTLDSQSSVRFNNTPALGNALVEWTIPQLSLQNYRKFYSFKSIFLTSIPTNGIELRFGNDNTNYLTSTITSQFSGKPLVANQWNTLAFDLNIATIVGTINDNAFAYEAINLLNAPAGFYYISSSFVREWILLDYWYYSIYNVQTESATSPNQEYFIDPATQQYVISSSLTGDSEWADVVMYDAMLLTVTDRENNKILGEIKERRNIAWLNLLAKYPSMRPNISTNRYRMTTDFNGYDCLNF